MTRSSGLINLLLSMGCLQRLNGRGRWAILFVGTQESNIQIPIVGGRSAGKFEVCNAQFYTQNVIVELGILVSCCFPIRILELQFLMVGEVFFLFLFFLFFPLPLSEHREQCRPEFSL